MRLVKHVSVRVEGHDPRGNSGLQEARLDAFWQGFTTKGRF